MRRIISTLRMLPLLLFLCTGCLGPIAGLPKPLFPILLLLILSGCTRPASEAIQPLEIGEPDAIKVTRCYIDCRPTLMAKYRINDFILNTDSSGRGKYVISFRSKEKPGNIDEGLHITVSKEGKIVHVFPPFDQDPATIDPASPISTSSQ